MELHFYDGFLLSDLTDDEKKMLIAFMQDIHEEVLCICSNQINSKILRTFEFGSSYILYGKRNILYYGWSVTDYYIKMSEIDPDPEIVPDYGPNVLIEVNKTRGMDSSKIFHCSVSITLFNNELVNEFFINFDRNGGVDSSIVEYLKKIEDFVNNSAQAIINDINLEWNIL